MNSDKELLLEKLISEKDLRIQTLELALEKAQQPIITYEKLSIVEFFKKNYCNIYFPIVLFSMYFFKTSLYFWTEYTGINTKNFWKLIIFIIKWIYKKIKKIWNFLINLIFTKEIN